MARWTIFKGWHFSLSNLWQRLIPRIGARPVMYQIKISGSSWFPYQDKDDLDINKLCGFSYGHHHKNSVRIGWAPNFEKEGYFQLYFYIYNEGIRTIKKIDTIKADKYYSIMIHFVKDLKSVFADIRSEGEPPIRGSEIFILPGVKIGYMLWFYFGGDKKAPSKMTAWIKII